MQNNQLDYWGSPHNIQRTAWSHQLEHSLSFMRWPICPILSFWGSKVHKNVTFPAFTPINCRAKFDATSFILGREIRNRTNKKQTNSKRYIHTLPIGMCG